MDLTISIDWRHGHKSGSFGSSNLPWTDFKLLLGFLLPVSENSALNRKFYKLLNPNYSLEIPVWNFLISRVVLEKLQGALLDLIPWIAALYFIIKSLQASAAQAYASLRQSGTPDFIVGYISNISTSDNLKSYGDMINFHAVNFMLISAGIIVALTVLCHLVFAFIFEVL